MRALPFAKLKVVDLAWVVAGPLIGRTLADYGATVVRVESSRRIDTARMMGPFPRGQVDIQQSALYENCNAGKLGLSIDLSSPGGQQVVRDLVAWADVVIESFSPGQMKKWGLGYDNLREIKPDLVMLSTSLMGQSGPFSSMAGFGNIGAAMAGFQQLVGEPDELPIGPFGPYTDYVGPRCGIVALLAALDHRRRTGEGCWLDVSQAEAGIQLLAPQLADYSVNGHVVAANGNRDTQMAPHGVFRCAADEGAEESWIAIAARDDRDWQALARIVGGPALAHDERYATLALRQAAEAELHFRISAWTEQRTAQEVVAILQAQQVPTHVAAGSADMLNDPQLMARQHFIPMPHALMGTSTVETSRYLLSETPGGPVRAAPHFGRDNEEVLMRILGYNEDEVSSLRNDGVLT